MAKGLKTGGRTKGTLNVRTVEVQAKLEELGCDPIEGMVRIAKSAEKDGDKALAGQMYKELAQYVAPKRKMLDVVATSGTGVFGDSGNDSGSSHFSRWQSSQYMVCEI